MSEQTQIGVKISSDFPSVRSLIHPADSSSVQRVGQTNMVQTFATRWPRCLQQSVTLCFLRHPAPPTPIASSNIRSRFFSDFSPTWINNYIYPPPTLLRLSRSSRDVTMAAVPCLESNSSTCNDQFIIFLSTFHRFRWHYHQRMMWKYLPRNHLLDDSFYW